MLVFAKPPVTKLEDKHRITDVIEGSGREKELHEWQQGLDELTPLLTAFSEKGDLVVDPFAGSGTTLLASLSQQRRTSGIEVDEDNVEVIQKRLSTIICE